MIVTGKIINAQTGESIPGANVFVSDAAGNMLNPPRGVATGYNGIYSIDVPAETFLTATFVGLQRQTMQVSGKELNFNLSMASGTSLPEIETSAKKPFNWKLWLGILALTAGAAFLVYDISNKQTLLKA